MTHIESSALERNTSDRRRSRLTRVRGTFQSLTQTWNDRTFAGTTLILLLLTTAYTQAQIRFEDVAHKAGVNFQLRNGATGDFHQPELMLGGVAVLDYNNDGCVDILFTNGA